MPAGGHAIYCRKGNRIRANPGGGGKWDAVSRGDIQKKISEPAGSPKAV